MLFSTLLYAGQAAAFWRLLCDNPIVTGRYDPIVNPGTLSSHAHTIFGGSGFSISSDYDDLRSSSCTSCQIKQDLSAYWVPQLYYQNPNNGSFEDVPVLGGATVYYLQRSGNSPLSSLIPFPPGFQMLAGNPMLRQAGSSLEQGAVNFVCLDYEKGSSSSQGLPTKNCPQGLRAQIVFPSCWNGKDLDTADHKSHMAYPWAVSEGDCPAGYPYRFITIFYEVTFVVDYFKDRWYSDRQQPFVFSTGDPTGYGFHGDFVNGWDTDFLNSSIQTCLASSGLMQDCPLFDIKGGNNCHITPQANEQVLGKLDTLPGCNPVQFGPNMAKMTPSCGKNKTQVWNDTMQYESGVAPPGAHILAGAATIKQTAGTWNYTGCYRDLVSNNVRTLPQGVGIANMTVEKCVAACSAQGYGWAGLEWSQECYCGTAPPASYLGGWQTCDYACAGDTTEVCGGSGWLSVYSDTSYIAPVIPQTSTDGSASYVGCFVDTSSRILPGRASSNGTVDGCVASCTAQGYSYAGVEYLGNECYCGNSLSATRAPDSDCNTKCIGDSTQLCGGGWRVQAYSLNGKKAIPSAASSSSSTPTSKAPAATSSSAAPPALTPVPAGASFGAYKYGGCYTDNTNGQRALRYQLGSNNTVPGCVAACSAVGFKLSGVEYGGECWCDQVVNKFMSQAPESDCNMNCWGDKSTKCGAGNRLSIYNATAMVSPTLAQSSNSLTFLGCYTDSTSNRVMTRVTAAKSTVDSCTSACSAKGFSFAGIEYGGECYCSNAAPTSTKNDASQCSMPCNDDFTQLCGAGDRLQVYGPSSPNANNFAAAAAKASSSAPVSAKSSAPVMPASSVKSSSAAPAIATPSSSKPVASSSSSKPVAALPSSSAPPAAPAAASSRTFSTVATIASSSATPSVPTTSSSSTLVKTSSSSSSSSSSRSSSASSSASKLAAVTGR
ncbi:hypothetical protein PYCC9005_003858 [Savitreella phatthalungensis]